MAAVERALLAAAAGYLLGTLPSADAAARLATGGRVDLRTRGTGNPGAVNAMAVLGRGWGSAVLGADMAKAVVAARLGERLAGARGAHLGASAAVVGHCFPAWRGWRGGKGVAASCGQCLATFPAYFPVDLAVALVAAKGGGRALPATAAASVLWVAAGTLWWRRRLPNGWGPAPSAALPLAAAVSSAAILARFVQSPVPARPLGPAGDGDPREWAAA